MSRSQREPLFSNDTSPFAKRIFGSATRGGSAAALISGTALASHARAEIIDGFTIFRARALRRIPGTRAGGRRRIFGVK